MSSYLLRSFTSPLKTLNSPLARHTSTTVWEPKPQKFYLDTVEFRHNIVQHRWTCVFELTSASLLPENLDINNLEVRVPCQLRAKTSIVGSGPSRSAAFHSAIRNMFSASKIGVKLGSDDLEVFERALEKEKDLKPVMEGSEQAIKFSGDTYEDQLKKIRKLMML